MARRAVTLHSEVQHTGYFDKRKALRKGERKALKLSILRGRGSRYVAPFTFSPLHFELVISIWSYLPTSTLFIALAKRPKLEKAKRTDTDMGHLLASKERARASHTSIPPLTPPLILTPPLTPSSFSQHSGFHRSEHGLFRRYRYGEIVTVLLVLFLASLWVWGMAARQAGAKGAVGNVGRVGLGKGGAGGLGKGGQGSFGRGGFGQVGHRKACRVTGLWGNGVQVGKFGQGGKGVGVQVVCKRAVQMNGIGETAQMNGIGETAQMNVNGKTVQVNGVQVGKNAQLKGLQKVSKLLSINLADSTTWRLYCCKAALTANATVITGWWWLDVCWAAAGLLHHRAGWCFWCCWGEGLS